MSLFASADMAAGYASARPQLHRPIVERFRSHVPAHPSRALDLGCGSGLSTQALDGIAARITGLEPVEAMLPFARAKVPAADFLCARAELLPFPDRAFDLVTAAGSINFCDVDAALGEAARVLRTAGALVVYDFSPGRFSEEWFERFVDRYPWPASGATRLDPDLLAARGDRFSLHRSSYEHFAIELPMSLEAYLNYMLTETNVAAAVGRGTSLEEIRTWCGRTLDQSWPHGEAEATVTFRGYWVCLAPFRER